MKIDLPSKVGPHLKLVNGLMNGGRPRRAADVLDTREWFIYIVIRKKIKFIFIAVLKIGRYNKYESNNLNNL